LLATIALKANAKQLVLGHYSTRYGGLEGFKAEAETVFEDVLLAEDGKVFNF
jgi:ribonuclease Z